MLHSHRNLQFNVQRDMALYVSNNPGRKGRQSVEAGAPWWCCAGVTCQLGAGVHNTNKIGKAEWGAPQAPGRRSMNRPPLDLPSEYVLAIPG